MRTLVSLLLFLGLTASLQSQEPPKLPMPPQPDTMNVVSAQAVSQQGKVMLYATNSKPVMVTEAYTYTEPVPVTVEKVDGQGNKVTVTEMKLVTKQGTRTLTKYVFEIKLLPVTGNDNVTLTDATGRKLTDAEVLKALEKPTFIFEFKGKPHAEFLKSLKPETVVMSWKQQLVAPARPAPVGPGTTAPVMPLPAKPDDPSAIEQKLIELANAERTKAGIFPLEVAPLLMQAARQHSDNMARQGKLDHTLDEKGVDQRLTALGYRWSNVGENIAQGQRTPAQAIETWMNSEDHRNNMLSTKFSRIGVAVTLAPDGQRYWTMVLAQPR